MIHCNAPQPDEYEKLGSYALIGLPDDEYKTRWVASRRLCPPVVMMQLWQRERVVVCE
jgi:hypothetical protein